MKLVLDMNIPEVWKDFLADAGHDAVHWSEIGDIHADDTAIFAWARKYGRISFTHDLDFGSLLFSTNAHSPSVIQVRIEHIVPTSTGAAVLETLDSTAEALSRGAIVTIAASGAMITPAVGGQSQRGVVSMPGIASLNPAYIG